MTNIKKVDDAYFDVLDKCIEGWQNAQSSNLNAELITGQSEIIDLNSDTADDKKSQLFDLYNKYQSQNLSSEERAKVAAEIVSLRDQLKGQLESDRDEIQQEIDELSKTSQTSMTKSIIAADKEEYDKLNQILNGRISAGTFLPLNINNVNNRLDISELPLNFSESNLKEIEKLKEETGARFGLDIAHYQYPVDYKKVKASGIDYVIIQWGGRGSSGNRYIDGDLSESEIRENIQSAIDAGLDVGLYTWGQPVNESEAIEEANWTVDFINSLPSEYRNRINMPIAYDYEAFGGRSEGISMQQHTDNIKAFNKVLSDAGYETMTYSMRSAFGSHIDGDAVLGDSNYNWVAEYGANNKYDGEYSMWQYGSDAHVSGIENRVDINVYYEK